MGHGLVVCCWRNWVLRGLIAVIVGPPASSLSLFFNLFPLSHMVWRDLAFSSVLYLAAQDRLIFVPVQVSPHCFSTFIERCWRNISKNTCFFGCIHSKCEALLSTFNFFHSFLVLQVAHRSCPRSSPALLSPRLPLCPKMYPPVPSPLPCEYQLYYVLKLWWIFM